MLYAAYARIKDQPAVNPVGLYVDFQFAKFQCYNVAQSSHLLKGAKLSLQAMHWSMNNTNAGLCNYAVCTLKHEGKEVTFYILRFEVN